MVEPGAIRPAHITAHHLVEERPYQNSRYTEENYSRTFLLIPGVSALSGLREVEIVADAPTLLAGEVAQTGAVEVYNTGFDFGYLRMAGTDSLMHYIDIKKVGVPLHLLQQQTVENEPICPDGRQRLRG